MRTLAILVLLVGCTKDTPKKTDSPEGTPTAKQAEAPPSTGTPPPRTGTVPPIRPTAPIRASSLPAEANPPGAPKITGTLELDRGVRYIDEKVGTGATPVSGKPVSVHYTGWLTEGDGKSFDSSVDRGEPIKFNFDGGQVIKGWDIGLSSMKVGGKRRIIIPAELAYGDRGAGGAIPPGAMLVFDVELMDAEN